MAGLPDSEKTLRICITVYTQYRRVPDGQADGRKDGQISCHGIVRAVHMRRAVKMKISELVKSAAKQCLF